jgi:hypothetical protein
MKHNCKHSFDENGQTTGKEYLEVQVIDPWAVFSWPRCSYVFSVLVIRVSFKGAQRNI